MTNGSESVLSVRGCLKVIGVLVLLTIVVMVALFVLARSTADWVTNGVRQGLEGLGEAIASIPESVANAVSDAFRSEMRANIETKNLLAHSVANMGTLVTASQEIEVDVKVGTRAGLLNRCWASVEHDVVGTIEAGVDLSQVQGSDFTHDIVTNSWVAKLGTARVHSCRIDYIRQSGYQTAGLVSIGCNQVWDELRLLAETAILPELRKEALAEGLLAEAELEAEVVLGNFLGAVTGSENISIVFESEPVTDFPESCLREPPTGWKFDEESDSWVQE